MFPFEKYTSCFSNRKIAVKANSAPTESLQTNLCRKQSSEERRRKKINNFKNIRSVSPLSLKPNILKTKKKWKSIYCTLERTASRKSWDLAMSISN